MSTPDDKPILFFATQQDWEDWLETNHAASNGIWLKMAKKASGIPSVDYAQALECALCYGWIDGQKNPLDETYWLQKFTPRRPKSNWSKVNRDKVEGLIAAGRMKPAGLRQVEAAQADGRWALAYEGQRSAPMPPDLQAALDLNPQAQAFYNTLDSANRYAVLYRVHTAKTPEKRAEKVEKLVAMLERGEKFH